MGAGARSEERLLLFVAGRDGPPAELPRSGVLTVGGAEGEAGLVVEGRGVARVHCAIGRLKGGGWALKDLGSPAGTRVNGRAVQTARLRAGDVIELGDARLHVADPTRREAPPAAASRARGEEPLPEIAGFRVQRLLGKGAMGRVYLAVQESLDRPVALKILPPHLEGDADFVRRFLAEARAAAALSHPNVVTIHDVGEDRGRHYLSMEYMARGSLETRVAREGRLPWREVLDVLRDAAAGLVYAESRGVVHRDIKPANLMVDEAGTTNLADLGLAIHLEAELFDTMAGKVFGTPHFIAPEQARGERVDSRSDLYSLGATAYRLLSGRTPFEGETTREILRGHFTEDPPPLAELVPDAPPRLAELVHRMLRKDAAQRPSGAREVLEEVERLRSAAVVGAGESGTRRAALALVLVVAAAAGGWLVWRGLQGDAGEDRASAAETAAAPIGAASASAADDAGEAPDGYAPGGRGDLDDSAGGGNASAPPVDADVVDGDRGLQLFELQAENARLQLAASELPRAERIAALEGIARDYAGTTTAARVADELDALRAEIAAEERAAEDRRRAYGGSLDALRRAAQQEPGEALRGMIDVPGQDALLAYPEFAAARGELYAAALERLAASADARLARADELAGEGAFETLEELLAGLVADLELPELPPDLAAERVTPALDRLERLGALAAGRLAGLDHARAVHAASVARADALRVAAEAPELEAELAALDLEAAVRRLRGLEETLATPRLSGWARALRLDAEAARDAREALTRALQSGGWRRRSVPDPRSGRQRVAEAVGVDPQGLLLADAGGATAVPWRQFGGDAWLVHQLFHERLERDYTPSELRGIEALVRLTAVVQAVRAAAPALAPGGADGLGERAAQEVLRGFEEARPWVEAVNGSAAYDHELDAARHLAECLELAGAGAWSTATARLEALPREHADTLLVRLCSDGRLLSPELPPEPEPEPAVAPPDEGAAPETAAEDVPDDEGDDAR